MPALENETQGAKSVVLHFSRDDRFQEELGRLLDAAGFSPVPASPDVPARTTLRRHAADVVILDGHLPDNVWRDVRQAVETPERSVPVLLVAPEGESRWPLISEALGLGTKHCMNDVLTAPLDRTLLAAKLRSLHNIGRLRHELTVSNHMLTELNRYLDRVVDEKAAELDRVNRLRRFFSPQIVDAIVSDDRESVLKEHRREITVVFLDLRGFTEYADTTSPGHVFKLVRSFDETAGPIVFRYGGTLERFTGDGMMVFLGDPQPLPDHAFTAVRMAWDIRRAVFEAWASEPELPGLGIGIATGEAAIGTIGFEQRRDYAALGRPTNLAARLCSLANDGEILVSDETHARVRDRVRAVAGDSLNLKGFSKPVTAYSIKGLSASTTDRAGKSPQRS